MRNSGTSSPTNWWTGSTRWTRRTEPSFVEFRDLFETSFARFDAKLEQRVAELRAEMGLLEGRILARIGVLEGRFGTLEGRLVRWMFVFWAASLGSVLALR